MLRPKLQGKLRLAFLMLASALILLPSQYMAENPTRVMITLTLLINLLLHLKQRLPERQRLYLRRECNNKQAQYKVEVL